MLLFTVPTMRSVMAMQIFWAALRQAVGCVPVLVESGMVGRNASVPLLHGELVRDDRWCGDVWSERDRDIGRTLCSRAAMVRRELMQGHMAARCNGRVSTTTRWRVTFPGARTRGRSSTSSLTRTRRSRVQTQIAGDPAMHAELLRDGQANQVAESQHNESEFVALVQKNPKSVLGSPKPLKKDARPKGAAKAKPSNVAGPPRANGAPDGMSKPDGPHCGVLATGLSRFLLARARSTARRMLVIGAVLQECAVGLQTSLSGESTKVPGTIMRPGQVRTYHGWGLHWPSGEPSVLCEFLPRGWWIAPAWRTSNAAGGSGSQGAWVVGAHGWRAKRSGRWMSELTRTQRRTGPLLGVAGHPGSLTAQRRWWERSHGGSWPRSGGRRERRVRHRSPLRTWWRWSMRMKRTRALTPRPWRADE